MKRGIFEFKCGLDSVSGCCPVHDPYPNDSYANRRSTKARARGKRNEHKYVRTLESIMIRGLINEHSIRC